MLRWRLFFLITIIGILLINLAACAGRFQVQPQRISGTVTEQFEILENEIAEARQKQADVLAPTWFAQAETSLEEAKEKRSQGADIAVISDKIAYSRAETRKAQEIAATARNILGEVIEARELARKAGAAELDEYPKAEAEFLKTTKALENGDIKVAEKNKINLRSMFLDLEFKAIRNKAVGKAEAVIEQAEQEGAWKYATSVLAFAKKKLKDTDDFIAQNRYQQAEFEIMAEEALFQAQRLLNLTRRAKEIQTREAEQTTLWIEKSLHTITQKLSAPDKRNEPFEKQIDNIIASIEGIYQETQKMQENFKTMRTECQNENNSLREEISLLQNQAQNVMAATEQERAEKKAVEEKLQAERRFQRLFTEIQNYFKPDEAEVYKQANQLVIRLKAIRFAVGKDVITAENYPLLKKVRQAIDAFGKPDVIIEGHTDSTGSEDINKTLSRRRAEAVRQYFVANETLPEEKIVAAGYGSSRPLASNATPEGRAINRRIDVIIKAAPLNEEETSSPKQ